MEIAVIIPCYNSSQSVLKTVESVLNQTYEAKEIIVVDDGSSDDAKLALLSVLDKIKFIRQKNGGVSSARNHGVKLCNSDWVAFCDSDDVWAPNKLETIVQTHQQLNDKKIFFHDFYIFKNDSIIEKKATHSEMSLFSRFKSGNQHISDILDQFYALKVRSEGQLYNVYSGECAKELLYGNFILPSSVVMTKELFNYMGGFDETFRCAEETEFFLRVSKVSDLTYIDLSLTGYHVTENSITKNLPPLMNGRLNALIKNGVNDKVFYAKNKADVVSSIAGAYYNLAYFYLSELQNKQARQEILKSLRYSPYTMKSWIVYFASYVPEAILDKLCRN